MNNKLSFVSGFFFFSYFFYQNTWNYGRLTCQLAECSIRLFRLLDTMPALHGNHSTELYRNEADFLTFFLELSNWEWQLCYMLLWTQQDCTKDILTKKKWKWVGSRHYLFLLHYHAGEETVYFLCQLPSCLLGPGCDYPWESVPLKDLSSVATQCVQQRT